MKREEGYYWVRLKRDKEWQPGQWEEEAWWIISENQWYEEDEIAEIGEKIVRKEK